MSEPIDYTELRQIVRELHDYQKHPERVDDVSAAQTIALASLPHPLLLAEQLIRERELRAKAEQKAKFFARKITDFIWDIFTMEEE